MQDLALIQQMYGLSRVESSVVLYEAVYSAEVPSKDGNVTVSVCPLSTEYMIKTSSSDGTKTQYIKKSNSIELVELLDNIFADCQSLQNDVITAAISSREITKNMVRVKSSNLWSVCLNVRNRGDNVGDLFIRFKGPNGGDNGGLYQYFDVPVRLYRQFISAPSKGSFFWRNIRNNYTYRRLDGNKRTFLPNGI